jgi:hypothetical protein
MTNVKESTTITNQCFVCDNVPTSPTTLFSRSNGVIVSRTVCEPCTTFGIVLKADCLLCPHPAEQIFNTAYGLVAHCGSNRCGSRMPNYYEDPTSKSV